MDASKAIEVRESQDWAWGLQLMHDLREKVTDDAGARATWATADQLAARKELLLVEVWNGQRLGAFVLVHTAPGEADLHTLLKVGGRKAIKASKALLAWAFGAGGLNRITGRCPGNNPAILHYAKLNGFKTVAHRADWLKHGKRFVSTYVELTKEQFEETERKRLCQ